MNGNGITTHTYIQNKEFLFFFAAVKKNKKNRNKFERYTHERPHIQQQQQQQDTAKSTLNG